MKKKLISILLVFAMIFSVAGCSRNFDSYAGELKKVSQWKGSDINPSGEVKVNSIVNGEKKEIKIPFEITGKSLTSKVAEVNMKMSFKDFKEMAKGDKSAEAIPDSIETKMYSTLDRVYMNREFFSTLMANNPELKNIKEEYISYPIAVQNSVPNADFSKLMTYVSSKAFQDDLFNVLNKLLKGFEPVNQIKASGRTFTYEADVQSLMKDVKSAADISVKNYKDSEKDISEFVSKLGFKDGSKYLGEFVNKYNKDEFAKAADEIAEEFKGSKVKISDEFSDDKYTEKISLSIKNKEVEVEVNMVQTAKRDDNVKIELPKSVKNLTYEEYVNLFKVNKDEMKPVIAVQLNGEVVDFGDVQPVIVDNRTLVPFRALLEQMGAEVNWDANTKEVKAVSENNEIILKIGSKEASVNGKKVMLDVPAQIKDGRTLVPLRFISENFGYKVDFHKDSDFLYLITIEK